MIAFRTHRPAPGAALFASPAAPKQQASRTARTRQLCVPRSSRTAAEELHSLVHDMAAVAPFAGHQALLQPAITETVHALASGGAQKAAESYSGDAQGIAALMQLLEAHATPAQRQALAAAAAAAAARPQQLSAQQEALLLLQEPQVATALRRMRRTKQPVLALASHGSLNPAVSRAVGLLDQVLTADQHTSRVVDFLATATALQQRQLHQQQVRQQQLQRQQTHRQQPAGGQEQQQPAQQHAGLAWGSSSQRSRQPARMAVIARSAAGSQPAGTNSSRNSDAEEQQR